MTYVAPYELSKIDIAAIKQADFFTVWLDCNGVSGGLVEFVKRAPEKSVKHPYPTDLRHSLEAPIRVAYDYRYPERSWACVESVTLYWSSKDDMVCAIMRTLRAGDAIAFEFYPDCHSNQYVTDAGLHADALRMLVYRDSSRVACWEVAQSICPDNSARMCKPMAKQYALITG
jgi:hypothetical protein